MGDRNPIELITRVNVINVLAHHKGAKNGISADLLVRKITGLNESHKPCERRLRTVISEMRIEGEHVCSTPANGYFIAETPEELNATCALLHSRAMTSLKQVSGMTRISLPDLAGQTHLPT